MKQFYPYQYISDVFCIDYRKLYRKGYRAIIFDIDGTLVEHGKPPTDEIKELFDELHQLGFDTLLFSKNSSERVGEFAEYVGSKYLAEVNKPAKAAFLRAIDTLKTDKEKIVYIGDQLFTDVYGANKVGLCSILVEYISNPQELKIGKRRTVEGVILFLYGKNPKYNDRLGDILTENCKGVEMRKVFSKIHPLFYDISMKKQMIVRHVKNLFCKDKIARTKSTEHLPCLVYQYQSNMIKRAEGVALDTQENKATNIRLSCEKISGVVIHPGEVFSVWRTLGRLTKAKGYKDGRIIRNNRLIRGIGGGMCNFANTIHQVIVRSPLDVIEIHYHSDSLAPDTKERAPLSSGVSIGYNMKDYRVRNQTNQCFQLLLWCEGEIFHAELRSEKPIGYTYELSEEDRVVKKVGRRYFNTSKIYRIIYDKATGTMIKKELLRDNQSLILYDYKLIPAELILKE